MWIFFISGLCVINVKERIPEMEIIEKLSWRSWCFFKTCRFISSDRYRRKDTNYLMFVAIRASTRTWNTNITSKKVNMFVLE
jgi:hypothetical protein